MGRVYAEFPVFVENSQALGSEEGTTSDFFELAQFMLDRYRVCILKAPQGRGKTVCGLALGYRLWSSKKVDAVVYGRAETFRSQVAIGFLDANRAIDLLIILDDLHLNVDRVAAFLEDEMDQSSRTRWVLMTRPTALGQQLSSQYPVIAIRPGPDDALHILKRFILQLPVQAGQPTHDLRDGLAQCEQLVAKIYPDSEPPLNLRRLGYFFRAWEPRHGSAISVAESVDEHFMTILADSDELKDPALRSVILPISALAANEISPAESFVLALHEPAATARLEKDGIIHRRLTPGEGSSYFLEPSDADDYLSAASGAGFLQGKSMTQYMAKRTEEYVKSLPPNLDLTLQSIRRNAKDLLPTLVTPELVKEFLRQAAACEPKKFTHLFNVFSEVSPQFGAEIYEGWLASRNGETRERKLELAASEISGSGIWTVYLFLRGLRLTELSGDRRTFVDLMPWQDLGRGPWDPRVSIRTFPLLIAELQGNPSCLRQFFQSRHLIPLFRKGNLNSIVHLLNALRGHGLSDVAAQLIYDSRPSLFAEKIATGRERPLAVAFFLHFLGDVPGFDRRPVLQSLKSMLGSPTLTLGSLGFILKNVRPKESDPDRHDLWRSLCPTNEQLKRLLLTADARDIEEAFSALPRHKGMKMLELASDRWQPILLRSSLGQVLSLQNSLRKAAKRKFEKAEPSEAEKQTARVLQDYSGQIVRALASMDWSKWPLDRIRLYGRALLNSVSSDGIYRYNLSRGETPTAGHEPCATRIAQKVDSLDLAKSLRLEIEYHSGGGDAEEGLREWARFFWNLYRADPQSPVLARDDVLSMLRKETQDESRLPGTRLLLAGCLCLRDTPFAVEMKSECLVGAIRQIREALEAHLADPERTRLDEAFFWLLKIQGALRLASTGLDRAALAELPPAALEKLFSHFKEGLELELCNRLRGQFDSLWRLQGREIA
jgi:hypothetical protein